MWFPCNDGHEVLENWNHLWKISIFEIFASSCLSVFLVILTNFFEVLWQFCSFCINICRIRISLNSILNSTQQLVKVPATFVNSRYFLPTNNHVSSIFTVFVRYVRKSLAQNCYFANFVVIKIVDAICVSVSFINKQSQNKY